MTGNLKTTGDPKSEGNQEQKQHDLTSKQWEYNGLRPSNKKDNTGIFTESVYTKAKKTPRTVFFMNRKQQASGMEYLRVGNAGPAPAGVSKNEANLL